MKNLIVIALLLCTAKVFAQKDTTGLNIPITDNAVTYEKVYNVANASQNLLYSNARVWFASTHPGGQIQPSVRDSILARLAGKASYVGHSYVMNLWDKVYVNYFYTFTIQIDCKDNKYRLRIYNIQYSDANTPIENLVQSLSQGKTLPLGNGISLSKSELRERLQAFTGVINNLLADVSKKMADRNDF